MTRYLDEVGTGSERDERLRIAGRPKPGTEESYVILEEPGAPVLMHYRGRHQPHFRRDCPHCDGVEVPKPLWYVGASDAKGELVIVELTPPCFKASEIAAKSIGGAVVADLFGQHDGKGSFKGLLVMVRRANFAAAPRVLRCSQRLTAGRFPAWPYRTREELARIWGVPIRPRIIREDTA